MDEQGIRRLYNDICNQLKDDSNFETDFSMHVSYSDGSSFKTQELEGLINDENKNGREIVGLRLIFDKSNIGKNYKKISLYIGGSDKNIELEVSGLDRQWIYVTKSITEERIKSFKKTRPRKGLIIFMGLLSAIIADIVFGEKLISYLSLFVLSKDVAGSMIFGINILVVVIWSYAVHRLFPNIVYKIGDGIKREESLVNTRRNLFWTVGIGLIISIADGLFF